MKSIIDGLERWVAQQPDKCLFSFLGIDGAEREAYTYAGFHDRTRYLAACLTQQWALRSGDRVLLVYPPGLEIIAAFFACARVGVIPVPVYPPTPANFAGGLAKLAFVARDCEARAALTTRELRDSYLPHLAVLGHPPSGMDAPCLPTLEWITTDDARGIASDDLRNDPGPVLFLQYTSGSTSDPKGVIVSHENLIHNALAAIDHVPTAVSWLPQYHDMGLIGSYIFPAITGGTTYGFDPLDFLKRPLLVAGDDQPGPRDRRLVPELRIRILFAGGQGPGRPTSRSRSVVAALAGERLGTGARRHLERFLARYARCGLRPDAHVAAYGLAENTLGVTTSGRRVATVDKRLLQLGRLRFANARTTGENRERLVSCGRPLAGVDVRIVNPETRMALGEQRIGEIWVAGKSTCEGYWNRPELSREIFGNTIANDGGTGGVYMRTGDLGFLHDEELFVCGRSKDLVIVRGVNYYPQDIEAIVESASTKVRTGGVAAFAVEDEGEALVVVAEVRAPDDLPDPAAIALALRRHYFVAPRTIAFVPSGTIAKTTSGKLARGATRQRWLDGKLPLIATHRSVGAQHADGGPVGLRERFGYILEPYALTGSEHHTLAEMGIDSITLVTLLEDIRALFAEHGLAELIDKVDLPLLQQITIAEFSTMLDRCECAGMPPVAALRGWLTSVAQQHDDRERMRMKSDAVLEPLGLGNASQAEGPVASVLLTGATGFFGPFLLHSLLRQTPCTCHVLVRATDRAHGMDRIRAALRRSGVWTPDLDDLLRDRMRVVCGDLTQPDLGLEAGQWQALTREGPRGIPLRRPRELQPELRRAPAAQRRSDPGVAAFRGGRRPEGVPLRFVHADLRLDDQDAGHGSGRQRRHGESRFRIRPEQVGLRTARPGGRTARARRAHLPGFDDLGVDRRRGQPRRHRRAAARIHDQPWARGRRDDPDQLRPADVAADSMVAIFRLRTRPAGHCT